MVVVLCAASGRAPEPYLILTVWPRVQKPRPTAAEENDDKCSLTGSNTVSTVSLVACCMSLNAKKVHILSLFLKTGKIDLLSQNIDVWIASRF